MVGHDGTGMITDGTNCRAGSSGVPGCAAIMAKADQVDELEGVKAGMAARCGHRIASPVRAPAPPPWWSTAGSRETGSRVCAVVFQV